MVKSLRDKVKKRLSFRNAQAARSAINAQEAAITSESNLRNSSVQSSLTPYQGMEQYTALAVKRDDEQAQRDAEAAAEAEAERARQAQKAAGALRIAARKRDEEIARLRAQQAQTIQINKERQAFWGNTGLGGSGFGFW